MRSRNVATDAVTAVFGRAEEPVQLVLRVAPREEGESGAKVRNRNVPFFQLLNFKRISFRIFFKSVLKAF